jgi:hypothetical protein
MRPPDAIVGWDDELNADTARRPPASAGHHGPDSRSHASGRSTLTQAPGPAHPKPPRSGRETDSTCKNVTTHGGLTDPTPSGMNVYPPMYRRRYIRMTLPRAHKSSSLDTGITVLLRPVRFFQAIQQVHSEGANHFIECGARPMLVKLVRHTVPDVENEIVMA